MGKRIIPRRRGRGHKYRAPDNRFKGEARHPRAKSSSGKVVELMHDPGRTAPLAKVKDQDGTYTMIAHDGMHLDKKLVQVMELKSIQETQRTLVRYQKEQRFTMWK